MRKRVFIACSVLVLPILFFALLSRFSGAGIRVSDGSLLGYSSKTSEWLYFSYPNIRVKNDGPYVFTNGNNYSALKVESTEQVHNKVERYTVKNEVRVTVDNELETQFDVPLKNVYPRSELSLPSPEKLLAISDLEGNFDAMVDLLLANNVINQKVKMDVWNRPSRSGW